MSTGRDVALLRPYVRIACMYLCEEKTVNGTSDRQHRREAGVDLTLRELLLWRTCEYASSQPVQFCMTDTTYICSF